MNKNLSHRRAIINDVGTIVNLLLEDELGKTRESTNTVLDQRYITAFHKIDIDQNQYLMIVENGEEIVGTCHLTIMPSLTFSGKTRMQIEAVRILEKYRGHKIGEWMMNSAFEWAKANHVSMIQLTTNKKRPRAKQFYERLGFTATHEGMKLFIG